MIKAAIFDMDGLLIDSKRIIMQACIDAAKQVGIYYTRAQYVELIGRVMQGLDAWLAHRQHVFPLKAGARDWLHFYRACAAIAAGLRVVVPDLLQPSDDVRRHCHQVVYSLEAWLAHLQGAVALVFWGE